jgi:ABC-type branched-subunit amino acid transport system ATPase component
MLLDEPSMGLSPLLMMTVFKALKEINRRRAPPSCWWSRMPAWP